MVQLTLANDEAYDLVMSVAEGRLDTVEAIAADLTTQPRRQQGSTSPEHRTQ